MLNIHKLEGGNLVHGRLTLQAYVGASLLRGYYDEGYDPTTIISAQTIGTNADSAEPEQLKSSVDYGAENLALADKLARAAVGGEGPYKDCC